MMPMMPTVIICSKCVFLKDILKFKKVEFHLDYRHCEEQSSATWQSQTQVDASKVFAIATSEDLLAMTDLNVLKKTKAFKKLSHN
jgi:hypothetical protein